MKELIFSVFLIIFSWQDFRRNQIKIGWLCGFGIMGMVIAIVLGINHVMVFGLNLKKAAVELIMLLLSLFPGLFLLFTERQTHGSIGSGDGIFFLITGCYLGLRRTFNLLMGAVFVSSIAGVIWMIILLLSGKRSALWENMRRKKLPFLPCLIPVWMWMFISENV